MGKTYFKVGNTNTGNPTSNNYMAETIEEVYKDAGTVAYYLIGLHMFAGLFHHYI
jgi:cytochrome b561